MEESPFSTPYDLWKEKCGLKEPRPTSPAMQRGINLEMQARWLAEESLGCLFPSIIVEHPYYSWMIASLDGYNEEYNAILEIKCPGPKDHDEARQGRIPAKYKAQLQHQLEVVGAEKLYYFSWDEETGYVVEVERDETYIKHLISKELEFKKCLDQRIPPVCRETLIENMEGVSEWEEVSSLYKQAKERKEQEEELVNFYKNRLIELSNGSEAIGNGLKLSKCVRKGSINYAKFVKEKNIPLDGIDDYCSEDVIYWTLKECN